MINIYTVGPVEEVSPQEANFWRHRLIDRIGMMIFRSMMDDVDATPIPREYLTKEQEQSKYKLFQYPDGSTVDMEEVHTTIAEHKKQFTIVDPLRGHYECLSDIASSEGRLTIKKLPEYLPFTTHTCLAKRCFDDVKNSDLVLANFLDLGDKRAIGSILELGAAHAAGKTIMIIVEDDSPLRSHPLLRAITALFIDDLDAAASAIAGYAGIDLWPHV